MFDKMIDSLLGKVAIIKVQKYNLHTKITNKWDASVFLLTVSQSLLDRSAIAVSKEGTSVSNYGDIRIVPQMAQVAW